MVMAISMMGAKDVGPAREKTTEEKKIIISSKSKDKSRLA